MTTARIIHLDRTHYFPKLPACLVEINGEIYIDVSSMLITDFDAGNGWLERFRFTLQSFEFTYILDTLFDSLELPNYIWENIFLVPIAPSLVATQKVFQELPFWVKIAERMIAVYLGKKEVILGSDYGIKDLVELVYCAKLSLDNPDKEVDDVSYDQIMSSKLATIAVRDSAGFKTVLPYRFYCYARQLLDFFRYRVFGGI